MNQKKRILVLVAGVTSPTNKNWTFFHDSLVAAVNSTNIEITMGDLTDLTFVTDDTDSQVYDRVREFSLDDFDLVVFRFVRRNYARAAACSSFLRQKNIRYIDSANSPGPQSKYSAQVMRQAAGLANIPSVFAANSELRHMIQGAILPLRYPIVIKDVNGRKGRLNFIAYDAEQALTILTENAATDFIVQKFIPNEGDYRFLVIGNEVKLVIYRQATKGSHLNNTSQGANSRIVEVADFDSSVVQDVLLAAKIEHLEVSGVDLMIDSDTGQSYIVEVNSSPQLATGAAPDLKMAAYAAYLKTLISTL